MIELDLYLISGIMLGAEYVSMPEEGYSAVVIDIFVVRLMVLW